jgi:hypothetical protein
MEIANTYLANEKYDAALAPLNAVLKKQKRRIAKAAGLPENWYCLF